jgi:ERCC4-related helicase
LVASYAAQQTNKPSLALYPKDDFFAGSGRQGPKEFDLISALTKFQNLLKQFGGHTAAAGVSIAKSEIPKLLEALHSESEILPENNSGNKIQTDYKLSPNAISSKTYYEIRNFFGPFGQGNPEPIGLIDTLQVKAIDQINNKHLRLTLTRGHQEIEAIFWGLSYHPAIAIGNTVKVAGALALNHYWNAKNDCYISLKAIELIKPASAETTKLVTRAVSSQENASPKLAQKSIRYPNIETAKTSETPEIKLSYSYKSKILREKKQTKKFNFPDDSQKTEACPFTAPEPEKVKSFIFSERQQKQIEVPASYGELKNKYELIDLNHKSLNDSQEQLSFICNCFEHDQSILAEAATGSGKTIVALVIAYTYLRKGENVIFLEPNTTLPEQAARKFREIFPKLESSVLISTGAETIQKRQENYSSLNGKIIFGTPQTIRNDFKQGLISPQQFKFVVFDECQHLSKEYDYAILCKDYFIPEKTRCLLLSAQAGISQRDIEVRIKKPFIEGNSNLIQDTIPVPRAKINEVLIPIELSEEYKISGIKILEVAYDFRQKALKKLESLELFDFRDQLKQIANFDQHHNPKLPSGNKLQKLGSEILEYRKLNSSTLKLESRNMLGSCASEIYAFAEALRLFNLYTAHGEALLVSTIAQKLWDINYEKLGVNFGKQVRTPYFIRLLYNEKELLEIFDQAVAHCSFSLLRANLNYDQLVEKFNQLRFTETQGDLSSQLSYIKPKDFRNDFFLSANRQYIVNYLHHPEIWHPKIKFLIADIEDKLLHNKSKGIIFTYHQEQARFLHQLINVNFKDSTLNAVLCLGKRTTNKKNEQKALDAFRTGKSRILIGTIDKVGEGLDIHEVKEAWKVESTIFRTTLAEQLPGRLGRGSLAHLNLNSTATLRHLVTAGTSEETNYQIMQKKTRRARRDLETRMLRGRRNS